MPIENEMPANTISSELLKNLTLFPDSACRVFHGRGKAFAGFEQLNIEWYPPYLFVQNFSDGMDDAIEHALRTIFEQFETIEAILVQQREWPEFKTSVFCERRETELPISAWVKLDNGLSCETSLGKNRNTGVFLDMRAGWLWVKENAQDKNVLNLFSYTSVFSLFALKGNAKKVDNVDMAANVLKIAQRNHQKNELHDRKTAFYKRNILKSDRWLESRSYDLIIIDPPPYQKKAFRGWGDYKKLLQQCKAALAEHGTMLVCFNNPQVSITEFKHDLAQVFPDALGFEQVQTGDEIKEPDEQKGLKTVAVRF